MSSCRLETSGENDFDSLMESEVMDIFSGETKPKSQKKAIIPSIFATEYVNYRNKFKANVYSMFSLLTQLCSSKSICIAPDACMRSGLDADFIPISQLV